MVKHRVQEELRWVLALIGLVWITFLVDWLLPIRLTDLGLVPRRASGLPGVFLMPFLHVGWGHLLGNTVPLAILLMLLAGSRANSAIVVVFLVVWSGILLWLIGRPVIHVGASGLVYGLIGFLLASGVLERRLAPLAIAALVALFYGGTFILGVLPTAGAGVSWDGHLSGAVTGIVAAVLFARPRSSRRHQPLGADVS